MEQGKEGARKGGGRMRRTHKQRVNFWREEGGREGRREGGGRDLPPCGVVDELAARVFAVAHIRKIRPLFRHGIAASDVIHDVTATGTDRTPLEKEAGVLQHLQKHQRGSGSLENFEVGLLEWLTRHFHYPVLPEPDARIPRVIAGAETSLSPHCGYGRVGKGRAVRGHKAIRAEKQGIGPDHRGTAPRDDAKKEEENSRGTAGEIHSCGVDVLYLVCVLCVRQAREARTHASWKGRELSRLCGVVNATSKLGC